MLPLDPTRDEFTWDNARACAERCAAAYGQTQRSLAAMGVSGQFVVNSDTDTEALVIDEGDCVSVAFRGSSCLRDWIQNFKALPEHPRKGMNFSDQFETEGEIHAGFLANIASVTEDLFKLLRSLNKPVILTGHSKGAAEATGLTLELARQNIPLLAVYPLESPRLFNAAGARIYNAALLPGGRTLGQITYRITNQNDIVPRLPLWTMNYRHVGQNCFLPVGGGDWMNPMPPYILISDIFGLYGAWRHKIDVLLADHNIFAVQKRIQNL